MLLYNNSLIKLQFLDSDRIKIRLNHVDLVVCNSFSKVTIPYQLHELLR